MEMECTTSCDAHVSINLNTFNLHSRPRSFFAPVKDRKSDFPFRHHPLESSKCDEFGIDIHTKEESPMDVSVTVQSCKHVIIS